MMARHPQWVAPYLRGTTARTRGDAVATAQRKRVVVVVEDDRPIGELLAAIINDLDGYIAIHVTRPAEAMRALEKVSPDLLVLDVGLPGMSGIELYDRLREDERLREIPVLFETAVSWEHRREFEQRGITAVVEKPFDLNEIVRCVRELAPPPRAQKMN